jgi:hypothetical protein
MREKVSARILRETSSAAHWWSCFQHYESAVPYGMDGRGIVRKFADEKRFITQVGPCKYEIAKGFVPNMTVSLRTVAEDAVFALVT